MSGERQVPFCCRVLPSGFLFDLLAAAGTFICFFPTRKPWNRGQAKRSVAPFIVPRHLIRTAISIRECRAVLSLGLIRLLARAPAWNRHLSGGSRDQDWHGWRRCLDRLAAACSAACSPRPSPIQMTFQRVAMRQARLRFGTHTLV